MLTKTCQQCGKPLKPHQQKYCSIECMAKAFTGKKMNKTTRTYNKGARERLIPELKWSFAF